MWDPERSWRRTALRDVRLELRLGLREAERCGPQPVVVDIELYRHVEGFPPDGTIADCDDYDRVYRYLTEVWPQRPHTELLEQLAEDLVAFCLTDPGVEACRVVLRKPAIYAGRAVPELEVWRLRRDHAVSGRERDAATA